MRRGLLCVAMVLGAGAMIVAQATQIGWVEQVAGAAAGTAVTRAGRSLPLLAGAALFPGDRVSVSARDAYVRIMLDTGQALTVCSSRSSRTECRRQEAVVIVPSPYTVPAEGAPPGLVTVLFRWVGQYMSVWGGGHAPTDVVETVLPRGDEILVPLLDAPVVRVAAGRRQIALAWLGGTAPYTVRLTRVPSGEVLFAASDLKDRFVEERVALQPAQYRLRIAGSGEGQPYEKLFTVLEAAPAPPAEIASRQLDPSLAETLRASWLTGQDRAAWRWEAYLQLRALDEGYAPALALSQALEKGARGPN